MTPIGGVTTTGETTVEVVPQQRHPVRPSQPKMPDRRVARKVGLVPQLAIRNQQRVVVETAARSRTRRLTPSVGSTWCLKNRQHGSLQAATSAYFLGAKFIASAIRSSITSLGIVAVITFVSPSGPMLPPRLP